MLMPSASLISPLVSCSVCAVRSNDVTNKVFMLSPANVNVDADEARAQLQRQGLASKASPTTSAKGFRCRALARSLRRSCGSISSFCSLGLSSTS